MRDSDGLIDLESAAARVSERTVAVMPVHLYGQLCDMEAVAEFASARGIAVIEDAAQAHGAGPPGARAGSFGLAAGFSFYPSKNLGALGDGGAICTDDPSWRSGARALRDLGRGEDGVHSEPGFNERLDGLQAAVLRLKLRDLDAANDARRRLAARYRELLPVRFRTLEDRESSVFHLSRSAARTAILCAITSRGAGIETGIHYSPALDAQPALSGVHFEGSFPAASAWASEEISLPIFPELRDDELARVAEAVAAGSDLARPPA